mmetsp:Transcript_8530/g.22787  ORF Transcript_8530/g.22787 Transcript_8530/m.22787 type:complete len:243 (+) Transcript_8530:981-1709(+)
MDVWLKSTSCNWWPFSSGCTPLSVTCMQLFKSSPRRLVCTAARRQARLFDVSHLQPPKLIRSKLRKLRSNRKKLTGLTGWTQLERSSSFQCEESSAAARHNIDTAESRTFSSAVKNEAMSTRQSAGRERRPNSRGREARLKASEGGRWRRSRGGEKLAAGVEAASSRSQGSHVGRSDAGKASNRREGRRWRRRSAERCRYSSGTGTSHSSTPCRTADAIFFSQLSGEKKECTGAFAFPSSPL